MATDDKNKFMTEAIRLAQEGMRAGYGGPFGAVVVKDGKIIGRGNNQVILTNDPTAHAEIVAIRDACKNVGDFQLSGCEIYSSCEPCPMCLGAIYWARPARLFYGCSRKDAAAIGFDDDFIYHEISIPQEQRLIPAQQLMCDGAMETFKEWEAMEGKKIY